MVYFSFITNENQRFFQLKGRDYFPSVELIWEG
ncbi:hypothetical protein GGC63_001847 [Paenibacillus sp. OAS669]|nr:hypothetical protein [Paenibacillus sp. OAS669]